MTRTEQQAADLAQQIENAKNGILLGGGIIAYERKANGKKLPVAPREKPSGNTNDRNTADKHHAEILEMLSHCGFTNRQMAKKIGCKSSIMYGRILYLRRNGNIICVGQTKRDGTSGPSKIWGLVT